MSLHFNDIQTDMAFQSSTLDYLTAYSSSFSRCLDYLRPLHSPIHSVMPRAKFYSQSVENQRQLETKTN